MKTKIEHIEIDGRKASMADLGDGIIKIIFDDGEMRIARRVEDDDDGDDETGD